MQIGKLRGMAIITISELCYCLHLRFYRFSFVSPRPGRQEGRLEGMAIICFLSEPLKRPQANLQNISR